MPFDDLIPAFPQKPLWRWLALIFLLPTSAPLYAACDDRFPEITPTRDFVLNDDGTTLHVKSGLIWSRCSCGQIWQNNTCTGKALGYSFRNAFEQALQANADRYLGVENWRLPTAEELQTLVDFHCTNPAINSSVFPNTPTSWYWSGTNYTEFPWYGQPVDFGNGNDVIWYKINYENNLFPVRLVRDHKANNTNLGIDSDQDGVSDALELKQGSNPQQKDNDITRNDRFLAQLYRDLLLREATSKELAQQLQLLASNPERSERVIALASTPEFQEQHLQLAITLAQTINHQVPNRTWLDQWRSQRQQGVSHFALIDNFMRSSELKASYLQDNPQNYVQALGALLLKRNLTASELQAGSDKLQSLGRAEYTAYWATSLAATDASFATMLVILIADLLADYPLDTTTLTFFTQQLEQHTLSPTDLLKLVLDSKAYKQRFMP